MALPEQRWIGGILVALGMLVFIFDVHIEEGSLRARWPTARRSKMWPSIGMIVCGIGFVGCAAWYFWPTAENQAETESTAVAHLTELGWTVKPSNDGKYLFEAVSRPLPPMKESASYFAQIRRPFRLNLQSVPNLDGLHYLAQIENCTDIGISAGEFTDISELRGFIHLKNLVISQEPLNSWELYT